jgi:hypothetical protein
MEVRAPSADEHCVDLEIRIFPIDERVAGYPVEITLGGQQEFPRGVLAADILPWIPSSDLTADGHRLFKTLFADSALRSAWTEARGQAPQRRIRLRIDPTAAELHALPWELLQEGHVMLSAQTNTPFSRYLPIALPWEGPVEDHPIRVLVVISDPSDIEDKYGLPQADVEQEKSTLESAFAAVDPTELQVDFLEPPATLERLEEELRRNGGCHILHYLGHGSFSQKRGQAVLYLQDAEGKTRLALDDQLAQLLARQGVRPRLVLLATCQSATRSTGDAFLGLAPKLVSVGVPAVVAMQDFVTVESALAFGAKFYQRLLAHGQVDQAVNEARSVLLTAGRPDAGVPVLFQRLKSGQLWGAEADARGEVLGTSKPKAFWTTLVRQMQRGRCTPIIGPRVHGSVLPTLSGIAQRWADLHDYPFSNRDEMTRVAQYLATTQGEDFPRHELLDALMANLAARVSELQPDGGAETLADLVQAVGWQNLISDNPNEAHRVLADLNLPLYLTTNVDSFMVEALKAYGREPVREICRWSEDLDGLDSQLGDESDYVPTVDEPLVYHFFGSDDEVDSLVITEDHFFSFLVRTLAEQDRIPYVVRDALSSTSLMFVGYSLYDWEFRVLMHGLVNNLSQRRKFKHVTVQLEPADAGTADTAAVQTFLHEYFRDVDTNVYWGSTAQFMAELREHWEGRGQ